MKFLILIILLNVFSFSINADSRRCPLCTTPIAKPKITPVSKPLSIPLPTTYNKANNVVKNQLDIIPATQSGQKLQAGRGKAKDKIHEQNISFNKIPSNFYKRGGGSKEGDFITHHSRRHKYTPDKLSTDKLTLFGENINVKRLREDTMKTGSSKLVNKGTATKYSKSYDFNISTDATPTGEMRVFINRSTPNNSSQFPHFNRKQ
jgi:hypothetical protein